MSTPAPSSTPPAAVPARQRPLRRALLAAGICALLAGATYALQTGWHRYGDTERTDNAYVKGDLTYVATKVSGYVTRVDTENNQRVAPGQVLVQIDPRDYQAAVDEARAAVARATADLAQMTAQVALQRTKIQVAAVATTAARASDQRATADFQRAQRLVDQGGVSRLEFDRARNEQSSRLAELASAQGRERQEQQQLAVLEAQRQAAQAALGAAQARLARAGNDLAATTIRAPREGLVAARNVRPGEYLGAGTRLMAVVPTQGLWVEAYLKETQIGRLQRGDRVQIDVDALPELHLCGRLESLSNSSGSELALIPPDNATGNFTKIVRRFPVRIALDPGQPGLDRLGLGMSVAPRFAIGSHAAPQAAATACAAPGRA